MILRLAAMAILACMTVMLPANALEYDEKQADTRVRLLEELAAAQTEEQGRLAEDEVWRFWIAHPDPEIRDAVAFGIARREAYDWDGALAAFNTVIEADPDYAEGWNQRAFIHFLKEDFDASFADLERALELEPMHFGALSGEALILLKTGRFDEGQAVLKKAVEIHPFLKERGMLVPQ
jgi:tetratricopeptide (TPR) repeat protein